MADAEVKIPNELPYIDPAELEALKAVERRMLWLSTQMIHHANNVRPNPEKTKVGGHQASSASVISIVTALYFNFLRAGDRVSIKPHASPAFHAAQYLLGNLDKSYLTTLREYKGLQAYPSRTKDPDPVDFSTGSVGLGAVAPVYAALASKYAQLHFGDDAVSSGRFIALMGDAELDEGNVWETVAEEAIRGLGNVIWIVDLNRQSLDRIIPGVRADRLKALFAGAGWKVFEAKYGTILESAMAGPGGSALRRRIDEMSNEEYQALIRLKDGAELRSRMTAVADAKYRADILLALKATPDDELRDLIANLGGHDLPKLIQVLQQADAVEDAPAVVFAYTVKGWGLPMAGDPLNHSQLLTQTQMDALLPTLGDGIEDVWAGLPEDSPAWQLARKAVDRLAENHEADTLFDPADLPVSLDARHPQITSTQEALGRALARLADVEAVRKRLVTMSPDVATSTHLSGWINKVGVFAFEEGPVYEIGGQQMLKWHPTPEGHHIELGISEMNLFMCLGQFGLSYELTGQHLIPIGTVYDPFVCRGLDALIYSLYVGSKMIFAGTPAGVSLSPEGGAHQSAITPSIGIELPGVVFYEPAFATEVEWILLEGIRQVSDREHGTSTYLRLSTKPVDQNLMKETTERFGEAELRRQVLAGGYRLIDRIAHAPELPASDAVNIFVGGIMVPEAVEAARRLHEEGVAANVIVATSTDRLFSQLRDSRRRLLQNASGTLDLGHLETLIPVSERRAPIVTIQDGASHAMSFLGSVFGVPVVPLGVDEFGQSGSRADLYQQTGIDAGQIVNAAMLSLELAAPLGA
ncbi:MAG TPA: 1-deoxy-D-xylulose-5-phosphate synthase N-terminal domain-containing protein [Thermomicrobiales bacterium]|nr:1-deoxy-D-xylulose-5-phosphate synthase N-terminal domain-containing protein [Thermomicrobiales bacterium]